MPRELCKIVASTVWLSHLWFHVRLYALMPMSLREKFNVKLIFKLSTKQREKKIQAGRGVECARTSFFSCLSNELMREKIKMRSQHKIHANANDLKVSLRQKCFATFLEHRKEHEKKPHLWWTCKSTGLTDYERVDNLIRIHNFMVAHSVIFFRRVQLNDIYGMYVQIAWIVFILLISFKFVIVCTF